MSSKTLIDEDCVVTLDYTVSDTFGDTLSQAQEAFLMGGEDLLPALQDALIGQPVGYSTKLHLEPESAFGDYDAGLLVMEARHLFPAELEPGLQFESLPPGCKTLPAPGSTAVYTVTDITDEVVVLDGNHPLAGIAVRFELKVTAVREATQEERDAGGVLHSDTLQVAPAGDRSKLH